MLTSSKKVSYSYARRLLILPVALGVLVLLSFTIKESLKETNDRSLDQANIVESKMDTVPAKYKDPKTGKIKGTFQIEIDGDMASFKDIKSKKELFKVPLSELSGTTNKVMQVQGFPLEMEKKVMFISGDSLSKPEFVFIRDVNLDSSIPGDEKVKKGAPRIIINGKEISPADLDKIDPSSIKTIDIRSAEKGVKVTGNNMNGMTWTESASSDGKKIVTVKVDSVFFDGKGSAVSKSAKAFTVVPDDNSIKVQSIKLDTTKVITVVGHKMKTPPQTVVVTTADTSIATAAVRDPRTLTITVAGNEKDAKRTYTIVRKEAEKSDLPKDVLYILDGKEIQSGSIKDVDPSSIQMMNVLKGENAVKKYGEKAKNGVIEITTKK